MPSRKHVVPLIFREEEILEDLVDVVPICILNSGAGKLHNELVDQGPGHVLHEIVIRMGTGDVELDVKHECE